MCAQDAQGRIHELEGCIHDEKTRVQKEKRDQTDQIRSHKAEIKSLTDKIERSALKLFEVCTCICGCSVTNTFTFRFLRLKKDLSKKDHQIDAELLRRQTEL